MANPRHRLFLRYCTLAALAGSAAGACGQSVNWGVALSLSPARHLLSNGQPLPDGFFFELGYFDDGFDPAVASATEWRARWHVVDCAQFSGGPALHGFTATADMPGPASDGKRAFIWGWNAPDLAGYSTGEVILAGAPGWTLPAYGELQGGAPSWTFRDPDLQVLAGSVTRGISGSLHKAGTISGTSVPELSQEHEIQMATWPAAPAREPARVRVLEPVLSQAGFRLQWEGVAGYTHYRVEYSDDLEQWRRDLPGSLVAGTGSVSFLDASPPDGRRFYRILPSCPP